MSSNDDQNDCLDPGVLECLQAVMDPEVGLSIVDIGLVYSAIRQPEHIAVAITLTTRSCPLGEMIVEEIREKLAQRFQDTPHIDVHLVWDPPWTPDLITDHGLELLGRRPRNAS